MSPVHGPKRRLAGLVAVLAVALAAAACGSTSDASIQETRPVTLTGSPLPAYPEAGEDPAIGLAMPEMEGSSFDGTPVEITDDGRPKVLLILAHW